MAESRFAPHKKVSATFSMFFYVCECVWLCVWICVCMSECVCVCECVCVFSLIKLIWIKIKVKGDNAYTINLVLTNWISGILRDSTIDDKLMHTDLIIVFQILKPVLKDGDHKTLGTSIIYSPLPPC